MSGPIPKPIRQKKLPSWLKRSPIKKGRKCPDCRGTGKRYFDNGRLIPDYVDCETCKATGRVASKPIPRSSKPIKKQFDEADFHKPTLSKIWPNAEWRCPFTLRHNNFSQGFIIDPSHILGRSGGKLRRGVFSSPFNCSPLERGIHAGPLRDTPEVRSALLKKTEQQILRAVREGRYSITAIDQAFREYSSSFLGDFPSQHSL